MRITITLHRVEITLVLEVGDLQANDLAAELIAGLIGDGYQVKRMVEGNDQS